MYNSVRLCAHDVCMCVCMWFLSVCAKVTLHIHSLVTYRSMLYMCNLFLYMHCIYFCTLSYNSLGLMFVVYHTTRNKVYLISSHLISSYLILTCSKLIIIHVFTGNHQRYHTSRFNWWYFEPPMCSRFLQISCRRPLFGSKCFNRC